LHQTRGSDGKCHQQRRPTHASPWKWPGVLGIAMMVMTMVMVMPAVAMVVAAVVVNVMHRRLAQWVAPG
jgi:poly(A) polymerase Pap1